MPVLIGLTLIIIVFLHFSKSRDKNAKKNTEEFWQKERDSQFVPRKDISGLDYITIPYENLPFCYVTPEAVASTSPEADTSGDTPADFSDTDRSFSVLSEGTLSADVSYVRPAEHSAPFKEELTAVEQEIYALSGSRILNLTGISNTELRLTYGTANLDPLMSYDQNFTQLIRALQKWGSLLSSAGKKKDAVTVLSYAVRIGSDIAATYALLARLYKEQGELSKIEEMKDSAESLTTLMKPSILRDLEQVLSTET